MVYNNHECVAQKVTIGIPQGCVLSTIVFITLINHLPEGIASGLRIFADYNQVNRDVSDEIGKKY